MSFILMSSLSYPLCVPPALSITLFLLFSLLFLPFISISFSVLLPLPYGVNPTDLPLHFSNFSRRQNDATSRDKYLANEMI